MIQLKYNSKVSQLFSTNMILVFSKMPIILQTIQENLLMLTEVITITTMLILVRH